MPYLGLDSAAQGFTPAGIVADMRALGARLIGLYVFNNDVPDPASVVKSAAFVQELETLYGGPCVLPIITIRTGDSPNPDFLVQDLRQWFPQGGRRVGHDLENTAFPPLAEMQALFAAEKAASFSPGIYGFGATQDAYASAAPDWLWGVQAYAEGFGYLPAPYRMWQWTDLVLGGKYDGNTVDDAFGVVFGTFGPPIIGGDVMPSEIINPPITVAPGGALDTVLLPQVNTHAVQAFVEAVDVSGNGSSVGVALVGDGGQDIASTRLGPGPKGTAEWVVPPDQVGTLVARSASAVIVLAVKQATRI